MAHQLMLHGHPVGYLPPTYASEILYDENTTEKEKIDSMPKFKRVMFYGQTVATGSSYFSLTPPSEFTNKDFPLSIVFSSPYIDISFVWSPLTKDAQIGNNPLTNANVWQVTANNLRGSALTIQESVGLYANVFYETRN